MTTAARDKAWAEWRDSRAGPHQTADMSSFNAGWDAATQVNNAELAALVAGVRELADREAKTLPAAAHRTEVGHEAARWVVKLRALLPKEES